MERKDQRQRLQQISALFDAAIQLEPSEWSSYLKSACPDESLRAQVLTLLGALDESTTALPLEAASLQALLARRDPQALVGQRIGSYQIQSVMTTGGAETLYQALDTNRQQKVALRILQTKPLPDQALVDRMLWNASVLNSLKDPRFLRVWDAQLEAGVVLVALEWVKGRTLAQLLQSTGAMPWEMALPLFKKILDVVAKAHQRDIIHGDLKPSDVYLSSASGGSPKVAGFGLTQWLDLGLTSDKTASTGKRLFYWAPEHLRGLPYVDKRSDLYSLGIFFHEMVGGSTRYSKRSSAAKVSSALAKGGGPVQIDSLDLPEDLARILNRLLTAKPDDRYDEAGKVQQAIAAFEQDKDLTGAREVDTPFQSYTSASSSMDTPLVKGWITLETPADIGKDIEISEAITRSPFDLPLPSAPPEPTPSSLPETTVSPPPDLVLDEAPTPIFAALPVEETASEPVPVPAKTKPPAEEAPQAKEVSPAEKAPEAAKAAPVTPVATRPKSAKPKTVDSKASDEDPKPPVAGAARVAGGAATAATTASFGIAHTWTVDPPADRVAQPPDRTDKAGSGMPRWAIFALFFTFGAVLLAFGLQFTSNALLDVEPTGNASPVMGIPSSPTGEVPDPTVTPEEGSDQAGSIEAVDSLSAQNLDTNRDLDQGQDDGTEEEEQRLVSETEETKAPEEEETAPASNEANETATADAVPSEADVLGEADADEADSTVASVSQTLTDVKSIQPSARPGANTSNRQVPNPNNPENVIRTSPNPIGGRAVLQNLFGEIYASSALFQGGEGTLVVELMVDASGTVRDAKMIKGVDRFLDQKFVKALQELKFFPATENNVAVPSRTRFPIRYKVRER